MKPLTVSLIILLLATCATPAASATEFHVAINGNDTSVGSFAKPFKTISAAARVAQPGDIITAHEGSYRERVTPPRGGESDAKRIVFKRPRARRLRSKVRKSLRTG